MPVPCISPHFKALVIKKLLIFFFVLILLAAAAAVIFVVTFDPNRFKPMLEAQLGALAGNPVRLNDLSLSWEGGLALKASGVKIFSGSEPQHEPAIEIGEVSGASNPFSLLRGRLEIGKIMIKRPRLHMLRSPEGAWKVAGLNFSSSAGAASRTPRAAWAAGAALLFSTVTVQDGSFRLTDESSAPPRDFSLTHLNLVFEGASFVKPFRLEANGAFLSNDPNVTAKVLARWEPQGGGILTVEDFRLDVNLAKIRAEEFKKVFTALAAPKELKGALRLEIDRLRLKKNAVEQLEGRAFLRQGRIELQALGSPLESLEASLEIHPNKLEAINASGRFADGSLRISGDMAQLFQSPEIRFRLQAEHLAAEKMFRVPEPGAPQLRGLLSGEAAGSALLSDWDGSLGGMGRVLLQDGAILNLNVLRAVFERLTIFPGLAPTLKGRLSEEYRSRFDKPHTVFKPVVLSFQIRKGGLEFQNAAFVTEDFAFLGSGRIGFDQAVFLRGNLKIHPELSEAFIRSVNELEVLANQEGELIIPVTIQSARGPGLKVFPDVGGVIKRLAAQKTAELIGNLLKPKPKADAPAAA